MEHIINIINQNMPLSFVKFMAYLYTTPGHVAMFMLLLIFIFIFNYTFVIFVRKFIKLRLYKKRKDLVYRLLFHRLTKIIKPFRYLLSLVLIKKAVTVFVSNEDIDIFFYLIFVFVSSWWLYEVIKFMLYLSLSIKIEKQQEVRRELFNLFLNIIKIVIGIVVLFIVLSKMGVDLTGLITSLGVGGIVIGLSAKDTLTNFFDSIRLVGENAFGLGDWIETEYVEGYVIQIGLAATRIRTFENALVNIPNSKLASGHIINWSKRVIGRRIKFYLKLKYTYDTAEIDRVLFEINDMLKCHPDIVNENKLKYLIKMRHTHETGLFNLKHSMGVQSALMVYLDRIDSYSMDILVYTYSISVKWEEWLSVKGDVIKKIINIIDESDLELAIPAEDIVLESK